MKYVVVVYGQNGIAYKIKWYEQNGI